MTQKETQTDTGNKSASTNPFLQGMGLFHAPNLGQFSEIQSALIEKAQEAGRHWLNRAQSETAMAAELASKLTGSRSFPEVLSAYQEWTGQHVKMATEDANYVLSTCHDLIETGGRMLSANGRSKGPNGST